MSNLEQVVAARRLVADPVRCRAIRVNAGLSLAQVAAACETCPSTISRWERGLRRPRTEAAMRWAAALREALQ